MEIDTLRMEIDALAATLGEDTVFARPVEERQVTEKIRLLLDATRSERCAAAQEIWAHYLPYAARLCDKLTRVEEGWEDALEYFASENAQFWLDLTAACLDRGDMTGCRAALGQILDAARMMRRDRITQVEILLQALDAAVEISDKKRAVQFYEDADRLYRKHLLDGSAFTGSAWLPKIKKMGLRLKQYQEKLRRYYQHAESVIVSLEADSQGDLERVIDYLQQNLAGRVKITRRIKEENPSRASSPGPFRARVKITLG